MNLLLEEKQITSDNYVPGKYKCGFCASNHHSICPGLIGNASNDNPDRTWKCPCFHAGHTL